MVLVEMSFFCTVLVRVGAGESLFTLVNEDVPQDDEQPKYCGCPDDVDDFLANNNFNCPFNALVQPKEPNPRKWTAVHQAVRTVKRAAGDNQLATDDDDVDDDYVFEFDPDFNPDRPTWPTPSGITEADATSLCREALTDTPVARACMKSGLIESVDNTTLATCVEDIKVGVL